MKKIVVLSILLLLVMAVSLNATPRSYYQKCVWASGDILSVVTNTGNTTAPAYRIRADIVETAGEMITTVNPPDVVGDTYKDATQLRLVKLGTAPNQYAAIFVQLGTFTTPWAVGNTLRLMVTYIATGETFQLDSIIPTGTGTVNILTPTFTIPQPGPAGFNLNVNSNYPGAEIWKDGVNTGFVTPHTFFPGEAGSYTALMPFVTWTNNPIVVAALNQETTIRFLGVMTPDPAMTPFPADLANIHIAFDAIPTVYNLTWAAPQSGPAPTGYNLNWNGTDMGSIGNVLTWATPAIAEGSYTWTITPYITDPAKGTSRSMAPVRTMINGNTPKGVSTTSVPWHFTIIRDGAPMRHFLVTSAPAGAHILAMGVDTGMVTPATYDIAVGSTTILRVDLPNYSWAPIDFIVATDTPEQTVNFSGTYTTTGGDIIIPPTAIIFDVPPVTPVIPGYFFTGTTYYFQGDGTGAKGLFPWVITDTNTWYIYSFYAGVMHNLSNLPVPPNPDISVVGPTSGTIFVPTTPWMVILTTSPMTLPVELSSFTAILNAEYFVNLTWVTESETEVQGFNVYRNETSDFANAVKVNSTMIGATNTSEQHTYNILDTEVAEGTTYYYWLENVDLGGGSALHGPQSVTVTGDPTPVLPEISMLNNAYPNPFRTGANTNISVSIKANETGTVTVYNILGQTVKSFKVNEGVHTLKWDGKGCGSGIYFYKLTTPTTSSTKKLVIVK